MPGRLDFSFLLGSRPAPARRREELPFRIAVIGDFGGRAHREASAAPPPRLQPVDIDSFAERLEQVRPRATLAFGGERIELDFANLDDFHPDRLLRRVPALRELQQQRAALADPARARQLIDRLAGPAAATAAQPEAEPRGAMFERLLGPRPGSADPATVVDRLLADLVRPNLVPSPDPRVPDLAASLAATAGGLLRELLHHEAFRELEATWRGLDWLVRNVDADEDLQVSMLDATAAELAAMVAADDLATSPLFGCLVERAGADAPALALVVAQHRFAATEADVRTLAAMGALGRWGGFKFVATGAPAILGTADLGGDPAGWQPDPAAAARWQALRDSPQADQLGLVLPRFLLRLPYGAATDPLDDVPFEEMPAPPEPAHYLWGAPGLAVAMLLARTFRDHGWALAPLEHDVGGLPCHTYRDAAGTPHMQPCAEVLWTERAVAAAAGLMVLQSHAQRDAARLVALHSLAAPATGLLP